MSTAPMATAKSGIPATAGDSPLNAAKGAHSGVLHPAPGATATLISDLRELFKVWQGDGDGPGHYHLGRLLPGLDEVWNFQRPDGLVGNTSRRSSGFRAGASALNEAPRAQVGRQNDLAPLSGRSLPDAFRCCKACSWAWEPWRWAAFGCSRLPIHSQLASPCWTVFHLCWAIYTPLKRVTTLATFLLELFPAPPAPCWDGRPLAVRSSGRA